MLSSQDLAALAEGAWPVVAGNESVRAALARLPPGFENANADACAEILKTRLASPDERTRRDARQLRTFYLCVLYSTPLGAKLARLERPALQAQPVPELPQLPTPRVRYDPGTSRLVATQGEIDVVIVGSGPAGSVLAHELRRGGRNVVLVDKGALVLPGAMDTRGVGQLMDAGGMRPSTSGSVLFRNGMAVGGGSTVNVDLAFAPTLPIVRESIERWRRAGEIAPEQWQPEEIARAYEWVVARLCTRQVDEREVNANNRILWNGALARGLHPEHYALNTHAPGDSPHAASDKRSAVEALVLPALQDSGNPLTLLANTRVDRVVMDGRERAIGLEVTTMPSWTAPGVVADPQRLGIPEGARTFIPARHVVLAAGALGSPAILLASRIGGRNVGRGIVAHPSMPLIGEFAEPIDSHTGTPASVYAVGAGGDHLFEAMSAGPEYVAMMMPGGPGDVCSAVADFRRLGGFGVLLVDEPSPSNRVLLDAQGRLSIEYELSESDRRRFIAAIAEAARILFAGGAKRVMLPSNEVPVLKSAAQVDEMERLLRLLPNSTILTSAHMQSTCKIGLRSDRSVVDTNHRVWGTSNLYIVDGSVFPASIGANPMQSIYTIAKVFADRFDGITGER